MLDITKIATGLELSSDGIWYGKDSELISYPSEGNVRCFTVEEQSFWFKHRNSCITAAIRNFSPGKDGVIFDIGGGNGYVALALSKAGFQVVLVEPGPVGARYAKGRGLPQVICATTNTAQFISNALPAVGLFDVVEHIEHDDRFLRSMYELIAPGGYLYATVPAYSWLWSKEDEEAGHFRRYTLSQINQSIQQAGFSIVYSTYIFRPLPIPILFFRAIPFRLRAVGNHQLRGNIAKDHQTDPNAYRQILDWLLRPEVEAIQDQKLMSFGGSCLVVAQKTLP